MKQVLVGFKVKKHNVHQFDTYKIDISDILGLTITKIAIKGNYLDIELANGGGIKYPMKEISELIYEPQDIL